MFLEQNRGLRLSYLIIKFHYTSVPHRPPQFNISVQHKEHTFSATEIRQFNNKSSSIQHQIPQFHTKNPSVQHEKPLSFTHSSVLHQKSLRSTHILSFFCVELRGFWCWTEGFWCGTEGCVELRGFRCGTEWPFCVELMCGTEGGRCGTEGAP